MKSRFRAAHLLVVVALGPLAAGSPSSPPNAEAEPLPDSLGALIYPTSSQLPPFPGESPALLDPSRWATSSGTDSMRCALELCVYERGVPVRLRSLMQRKPNQSLSARYLCSEWGWREPHYAGPLYVWNPKNDLVERSWRATDGRHGRRYREDLYQYRDNGLIWAYRRRDWSEDRTGPSLMISQYYDPSGSLAGFSIERSGTDTLAIRRVRGRDIEDEAFRKWAGDFR